MNRYEKRVFGRRPKAHEIPRRNEVHDWGALNECGLCMLLPNPDCPLCGGIVKIDPERLRALRET